jgi:nitrous oxide reductase
VERRPYRRHARAGPALGPRDQPHPLLRAGCAGRLGHHQRIQGHHGHQARRQPALHGGRHPPHHASYKDGNYDGRYAWINDKINSRIARIRLDYFVCDKITELPNVQGFHGIFPDKRDPVDPAINYTTRVFCGGEFASRCPTTGIEDGSKYRSLFTCVDAETMEVRWQVLIDGNCDLVATSYDGKLAATNQYNTEMGATTRT